MKFRIAVLALAVSVLAWALVVAGDDKPAAEPEMRPPADARWRLILKDQLKVEKNCDLLDVLTYSELKIGDEIAISGKISCVDGRQYDYSRQRPHQKFEVQLCEPSVC